MNDPIQTQTHRGDYASFITLIEQSSLGTAGARELRRRTSTSDALRAMTAAEEGFRRLRAQQPWLGLVGSRRHQVCLVAAAAGDRTALETLVADLTPLVWHVARGQGLNRAAAEEVVHSVWLALLPRIDALSTARELAGWLIVATRRTASRFLCEHPDIGPDGALDGASTPDAHDARDTRLWEAFRQLPLRCQELLRLTVLAGRAEYSAVAEALHLPAGSIGPTRTRCLARLRELLGPDVDHVVRRAPAEPPMLVLALGEAIEGVDPVPVDVMPHAAD